MADDQHTLELIGRHLVKAVEPLIEAGSSLGAFMRLLGRIGFFVSDIPPPYQALANSVSDARDAVSALADDPSLQDILAVLDKAKGVYDAIQQLGAGPVPNGADASAYAQEVGERLFELLLTDYLADQQPDAFNILSMLDVIVVESIAATPTRPAYVRTHFRWAELPKIVSEPASLPARVYNWGGADFRDDLVLEHICGLGLSLGLPVAFRPSDSEALSGYIGNTQSVTAPAGRSLILPFFYANIDGRMIEGALALQRLPGVAGAPPGLILEPRLPPDMPLEFDLAPSAKLTFRAGSNVGELFGITLTPPDRISWRYPLAPGTPPPAAGVGGIFAYSPQAPVVLLGDPKASRIELKGATAELGANVSGSGVDLKFSAVLDGLKLVVDGGEGDSFLSSVLGGKPAAIDVPLGIEWSRDGGIRFKGSAAFEVMLHPHVNLGPLAINDATIKLSAGPSGGPPLLKLEVGVGISGALGPLKFLIQGIGIVAKATFEPGNIGPFDMALGFKPPETVGLAVDAGGFTGGGFLNYEPEKGQYSGGLDLVFEETIAVRALAVLDTKTPDGSNAFSLLILITSDIPPITLPYGFKLVSVGGLLGLNRTVLLESLAAGIYDQTLSSILFPTDIIANAPRIIADLRRVFPAQQGHFLVGPMAKLTWNTPTVMTIDVGLILDLPRPAFAFLGILRAALPADDVPILSLQVNFVGSVDFASGQLRFDATLQNSRVLTFTLTGDMAVRVYWKENANILLSVGGFNPAYTPPPMNLGRLQRLSIILFEGNPDVRAEGYFAVTSNTIQFGARIQLSYRVGGGFGVEGFLSVDAVIHPASFRFTADAAAMVAVRAGGKVLFSIQLSLTLEGPGLWHAHGTASFEIGFIFTITIHVSFDVTVGIPFSVLLAPVNVLAELLAALANPGNWRAVLPPTSHQSVMLRALEPGEPMVLHPFGSLEVSQKVVPLGIPIQHFGSTKPNQGSTFRVSNITISGNSTEAVPTQEEFAPAQFFEMSDAEKLSRPSFDRYAAGFSIGDATAVRCDFMRTRAVVYEVIYLPEHHPVRVKHPLSTRLSDFALGRSASAQSPLSKRTTSSSALADRVSIGKDRFTIVSTDDLSLHRPDLNFDSPAAADEAMRALLAQQPELIGAIQVMPAALALGGA